MAAAHLAFEVLGFFAGQPVGYGNFNDLVRERGCYGAVAQRAT